MLATVFNVGAPRYMHCLTALVDLYLWNRHAADSAATGWWKLLLAQVLCYYIGNVVSQRETYSTRRDKCMYHIAAESAALSAQENIGCWQ